MSDTSNVSWMGHFVWSQPDSLHDFCFHADVLHFHAFKDQHSQKQGEMILKKRKEKGRNNQTFVSLFSLFEMH